MAGRSPKKKSEHFEKMKKEVRTKKERANKKTDCEAPLYNPISDDQMSAITETAMMTINDSGSESENPSQLKQPSPNEQLPVEEKKKIGMLFFVIGGEEFAFAMSHVKEIIRPPHLVQIPNPPDYLMGLCSIRGELLPVIDTRRLLCINNHAYEQNSRIIIVDIRGRKYGMMAEKVSEVVHVEASMIKEPPSSLKGLGGGALSGVLLLNDGCRVIMVLDAYKMIHTAQLSEYSFKQDYGIQLKEKNTQEDMQVVVFSVGEDEYAFEIHRVKEIIRLADLKKVPDAASYIEGLLSIRNRVLVVVNLASLLGKNYRKKSDHSRVIIVDNGLISFGVLVDSVSKIIKVPENAFRRSHSEAGAPETYIKGFISHNKYKGLLMVLDPFKLQFAAASCNTSGVGNGKIVTLEKQNQDQYLEQAVIFRLGENEYAIRVHDVREINYLNDIVRYPGAPVFIEGMVNLRNEVIPLLNLRTLFDPNEEGRCYSKYLVAEFQNQRIGIMIDSASEVIGIQKHCQESVSDAVSSTNDQKYIDSIIKLDDGERIVLMLDLAMVLNFL